MFAASTLRFARWLSFAAAIASLINMPAQAGATEHVHPLGVEAVNGLFPAGAELELICGWTGRGPVAVFEWLHVERGDDTYYTRWAIARESTEESYVVQARVLDQDHRIDVSEHESTQTSFSGESVQNDGSKEGYFTAAWAFWGEPADCEVLVNGIAAGPVTEGDTTQSLRVVPAEFESTAYVSTGRLAGDATLNGSYQADFQGQLIYFYTTGGVSASVVGPDGRPRDNAGREATAGAWEFETRLNRHDPASGALYAIVF